MPTSWLGVSLAIAASIGPALRPILIKMLGVDLPNATALITLRMTLALPFFMIGAVMVTIRNRVALSTSDILVVCLLGIASAYIGNILESNGLIYLSGGTGAALIYTQPAFVLLLGSALKRSWPSRLQGICVIAILVGACVVLIGSGGTLMRFGPGAMLILGSTATGAVFVVGAAHFIPRVGVIGVTCYSMTAGSLFCAGHFVLGHGLSSLAIPSSDLWTLGALVTISTVLPVFLLVFAIRLLGATNTSIVGSIGPALSQVAAFWFLSEAISTAQVLGVGLIVLGIGLTARKALHLRRTSIPGAAVATASRGQ